MEWAIIFKVFLFFGCISILMGFGWEYWHRWMVRLAEKAENKQGGGNEAL